MGQAVIVIVLAGASCACSLLAFAVLNFSEWDLAFAAQMNGLLSGLVATCSDVNVKIRALVSLLVSLERVDFTLSTGL
jgi:hypothetical protein